MQGPILIRSFKRFTDLTNLKQLESLKNVFFKTRQIEFTRINHILPPFFVLFSSVRFVHSQNI